MILTELVRLHGAKKWAIISKSFKDQHQIHSKTGKQCRERWNNNLSPAITKDSWTPNEEKILFDMHKTLGNKWSELAKFLKGRTDNSTKNHFYSIVRKNLRRHNKHKPDKEKIEGNIKELIQDSALAKILLKKPRHYHRKKNNKAMDKEPVLPKRYQSKPISSKTQNQSKSKNEDIKKIEKVQETETPKQVIEIPSTICCPTPINSVPTFNYQRSSFIFPYDINTENGIARNDDNLISSQMTTRASSLRNAEFSRGGDRKDSLIFFDAASESFRRNDSRNNSCKSTYSDFEFFRDMSRKNSDKTITGFAPLDLKSPSNMNGISFPQFSPKYSLDFHPTPKNKK